METVRAFAAQESDRNFFELQAQLEGTENRIAVARNRYIKAVQEYNVVVPQFPSNLTAMRFGFEEKPQFTVKDVKATPPAPGGFRQARRTAPASGK